MENKIKLTLGAIITLVLAISGTYFVADGDVAYHCESKDLVMVCEKLSSGVGTRCYFEETYKICKEGWVELEVGQEISTEIVYDDSSPSEGKKWKCDPEGCLRIS